MATVRVHYDTLLAPIYVWMAGGLEHALATGAGDVETLGRGPGLAIDLGAGFGMHAIPLARAGYDVLALDTSHELLDVLRANSAGLPVRAEEADLMDFRRYATGPATLVVCLGDTLTHLPSVADVERLTCEIAAALSPGGRFVAMFRDYTQPRTGDARFLPVRSSADRIHTCFLEDSDDRVQVHDLVYERADGAWQMRVSSYPKLKLAPADIAALLERAGLAASVAPGPRGMVRIEARF